MFLLKCEYLCYKCPQALMVVKIFLLTFLHYIIKYWRENLFLACINNQPTHANYRVELISLDKKIKQAKSARTIYICTCFVLQNIMT